MQFLDNEYLTEKNVTCWFQNYEEKNKFRKDFKIFVEVEFGD
jgi:hypothetical protein